MKRIIPLFLAIIMAILPASAKRRSAEKGTPAIKFETLTHDFGTVREEDGWVEHTFKFTNTGTAPLVIGTVSTTCGCSKAEFTHKPVAPGKTGTVTIRVTPAGIKGEFTKTAIVRTNIKGKEGKLTLTLEGSVIPKK